jgi:hypothetical protein
LERCQEVNRAIVPSAGVLFGNEEDFTACLGLEVEGVDEDLGNLEVGSFRKMISAAVAEYPNLKAVAATLRGVKTATVNDWGAICRYAGNFYTATPRSALEILDRVGGGGSFASGFIYVVDETTHRSTRDFLLQNDEAVRLYHDYAEQLPIIDFHTHLPRRTWPRTNRGSTSRRPGSTATTTNGARCGRTESRNGSAPATTW